MEDKQVIGVTLFESDAFGGWKTTEGGAAPTLRANKVCVGAIEVIKLDKVNHYGNFAKSNQRNAVYGSDGLSPTIQAAAGAGGGQVPHIIEVVKMESEIRLGNVYNNEKFDGGNFGGNVWGGQGIAPAMKTGASASQQCVIETQKLIIQKCGDRDKEGGYTIHNYSNCIPANPMSDRGQMLLETTNEKGKYMDEQAITEDSEFYNFYYEIDGEKYLIRIRKLIPLETWRLMGFTDEDFEKASKVNSNTQLYKQAGNSIVVPVLEAIFGQLIGEQE